MLHFRLNILRHANRLINRNQQCLLSLSANVARIIKSPLQDVELPSLSIPEYVWKNVDQWPDKVAFECGITGRKYRYAEARELSQRFAASLHRIGLKPRDTLAIVLPNTAEWPIIFLGAVEAGLIITTVNPAYTADEVARQLKDCNTQAIVTLPSLYSTTQDAIKLLGRQFKPLIIIAPGMEPGYHIPLGSIDFREMIQDGIDTSHVCISGDINDTVILPYSSGTTGLPKGTMLNHRCVVSNCAQINQSKELCISEPAEGSFQDIAPAVLPFFHIYGLCCVLLGKMVHGVKIVTLPRFEPASFFKMLDDHEVSLLYVAPPLLLFLASHPGVQSKYLQSLRYMVTGAAPAGRLDIERFLKRAPANAGVLQGYGMTETSPVISHSLKGCTKYESVGVPLPNTELRITNLEDGTSLSDGKIGEVCTRGPQVMQGYLNRPDATSEMIDSEGWLRTGDMGYYAEDRLYIVDRLKELIKVKGFQVAPAELEEILRNHPDIEDAAVIGIPHKKVGEVPKAYIIPKGSGISEEDVLKFVSSKVADYKQLRGGVEFVSTIPKSPSGKILRRILKEQNLK